MEFDYFYGQQAEQFSFYRIPKMLFTDDRFWNVSTDAKLLYGIFAHTYINIFIFSFKQVSVRDKCWYA